MKKQDVVDLYQSLMSLPPLKGAKFSYAVTKNLLKLRTEIAALQKGLDMSPEYAKYNEAREELARKHAEKNSMGDPVIEKSQYVIKDREAFDKEIEELKKSHQEAVDAREKQIKEYGEFLKGDIELELHKVSLADVPQDIDTKSMEKVFMIIEETNDKQSG